MTIKLLSALLVILPAMSLAQMPPFDESELLPGGEGTVEPIYDIDVFALPAKNLGVIQELDFQFGSGLFRKRWQPLDAGNYRMDGLGPLYNTNSCLFCHIKDGRGYAPDGTSFETAYEVVSMVGKLGVPLEDDAYMDEVQDYLSSIDPNFEPMQPHPIYGYQIQDHAIEGHVPEGSISVIWHAEEVVLSDGYVVTLRRPEFSIEDLAYGPLGKHAFSPRITPQLTGLGLLTAIPQEAVTAQADPTDADGDGISGRAQITWSQILDRPALGRFGWKGSAATVRDQISIALRNDMGISSDLQPDDAGDCTEVQRSCLDADHGRGADEKFEALTASLKGLTVYAENIGVPARRNARDPQVLQGRKVFGDVGCAACHTPRWQTGEVVGQPQVSNQTIWPYTDLLLHDMGPALADGFPEMLANGQEWRTPPLWGIGLIDLTNGREDYLHDGRARSLLEAILWHGGEGQASRDAVIDLNTADREALLAFLKSL